MGYRARTTAKIFESLSGDNNSLLSYNDFFYGQDYLDTVKDGSIRSENRVLMISLDSAQLFQNKPSDCWIYIWVVMVHPPDVWHKKKYMLPGGFIPGPIKPKILDSFIFLGFYHIAAVQSKGLPIWDALRDVYYISNLFIAIAISNGPGLVYCNGFVGYHGKNSCKAMCEQKGRHKPGETHYYPALFKPHNYDHNEIDFCQVLPSSLTTYQANLQYLVVSLNATQYKKHRLEMGISKPSIFLRPLPRSIPGLVIIQFYHIMHLIALNIPDLLISLWWKTIDCETTSNKGSWNWGVLVGDTWKTHGKAIVDSTSHLPGSFDCPRQNPAEKITSRYKAWEFFLYIYGLCPGILYGILPEKYWRNFCKLVFCVQIFNKHRISTSNLQQAHKKVLKFSAEFELLYYQQ
ncbi:hypothetical protein SERLA73DRAFT_47761 [Serpula lacrymans var. lacrymans S7.3]|uniref:Uncharacterized protein n=1 Tax=Serpula lacrymans var. lacrymans (strain S7.3) TaxID=936435 RepID=F8PLF9_SERL3|nr:hypothetical protein SERLA73DRAFT_47761 [Serpula lacrymans var. lacrymans S7.3]